MKTSTLRRVGATALTSAVVAGLVVLGGTPAQAAVGTATITPASGTLINNPTVKTSLPCSPGTAGIFVNMFGGDATAAFPVDGILIQEPLGNQGTIDSVSTTGVQTASSFDDARGDALLPAYNQAAGTGGLSGTYTIELSCSDGLSTTDTFTAQVVFTRAAGQPNSYVFSAPTVATTTVLVPTPASPQDVGTNVTLTATVTPASGTSADVDSGSVQFFDGATSLGTDSTVVDGVASVSTTSLPVGTRSLTAVYTPGSGFGGSTSAAVSYVINALAAVNTTTALSVTPTTAAAFTPVALHADVTPTSAVGQVRFLDGATVLGLVPLTPTGADLSVSTFTTGTHSITAVFVPTNPAAFNGSTSAAVEFIATAPTSDPDPQTIVVTVAPGTLTISTPYTPTSPFNLGTMALSADGLRLSASAPFGTAAADGTGVTITDTRAGDLPWTASATTTNFDNGSGGIINGQNLSFTSVTPDYIPGNALNSATKPVLTQDIPSTTVNGYAPAAVGSDGLAGAPAQFASAANGVGTVYVVGNLNLIAPTSTPAGLYTATVTFTIA